MGGGKVVLVAVAAALWPEPPPPRQNLTKEEWERRIAHFCFLLLPKAIVAEIKVMFQERAQMLEEDMRSKELRRSEPGRVADRGDERPPSL